MKTILLSALTASLLVFSSCGSGSSDTNEAQPRTVTVERGPILGAAVIDADGQQALYDTNGTALYTFETPPVYPISAYGGYIDINGNGIIDAGEVENTVVLQAESGEVITLLTTILSASDENATSFLLDDLNLNSALTPSQDQNVSALSNVLYQYLIQNNLASVEDINISDVASLKDLISIKIEEYETDDLNASQQEAILVLELDITKLDDSDADEANKKLKGQEHAADIIANLSNMSAEQKAHVIDKILKNSAKKDESDDEDDDSTDDSVDDNSTETIDSTENNESVEDENEPEESDESEEEEDEEEEKSNSGKGNGKPESPGNSENASGKN